MRVFETEELAIIRQAVKSYTNEHIHDLSEIEINALKLIYNKLRNLYIIQKNEDFKKNMDDDNSIFNR